MEHIDHGEILGRLDERSKGMKEDISGILKEFQKLNGKVAEHQKEITEIKLVLATSRGHWSGVNKSILVFLTVLGIVIGAIATMLWH